MEILTPKIYGLCFGAKRSIEVALANTENAVVFKEILHNKDVLDMLLKHGLKTVDEIDETRTNIIRAHGEAKKLFDYLEENKIKYIDATCPNVKRVQLLIEKYYNDGYQIFIIGKKNHPEVLGENGWCNNQAIIIENSEDIIKVDNKIFVVCQTTFNDVKADKLVEEIKLVNKDVLFNNTICKAQENIQKSSEELAKNVDLMIIIGGKNSSNTKELANKCMKHVKSVLVSSIEELREIDFKNVKRVGITGGASTPSFQIENYIKIIQSVN